MKHSFAEQMDASQKAKVIRLKWAQLVVSVLGFSLQVLKWADVSPVVAEKFLLKQLLAVPSIVPLVAGTIFLALHFWAVYLEQQRLMKFVKDVHGIHHEIRNHLHCAIIEQPETGFVRVSLNNTCNLIAHAFQEYSGDNCAAAIFFKNPRIGNEDTLHMAARSPGPEVSGDFMPSRNTRFQVVLHVVTDPSTTHYFSNNLKKLGDGYRDELREPLGYNATITVPIRCTKHKAFNYGILAIEGQQGGQFSRPVHTEALAGIADHLFNYIELVILRRTSFGDTIENPHKGSGPLSL